MISTRSNSKLYLCALVACALAGLTASAQNANPNALGHVERANKVYGKQVMSSDNQKIGNLNNLIVDLESGRILYATIGESKGRVGVPPQIFTQTPNANDSSVRANVTKQKFDGAPAFNGNVDKPEDIGQAGYISQVYQYFGVPAWWQGSSPVNEGSFHNVHKASEVIGMDVQNVNNQSIAKVNNVAVDLPAGRVVYIILTPGSNLNLGNNLLVLPPQAVTLSQDGKHLVTGVDQAQLASAPHFDKNNWPNLSDQNFASQVYQYYGKQAYFNNGTVAPTGR